MINVDIKGHRGIIIVIASVSALLFFPQVVRMFVAGGYPLGRHSYYALSGTGAYPMLLSYGGIAAWVLAPALLGILAAVLYYLILKGWGVGKEDRFYMAMLLISTPIFFFVYSTLVSVQVGLVLVLLGHYFMLKRKRVFLLLAMVVYSLVPVFGPSLFLLSLLPLLFLNLRWKMPVAFVAMTSAIVYYGISYLRSGFPVWNIDYTGEAVGYVVSDIGGSPGLGVFFLALSLLGIVVSWKEKKKHLLVYGLVIFSIVLSVFNQEMLIAAAIPLSFLAGFGISALSKRNWKLPYIRDASFLLIVCGILFSMVSFMSLEMKGGPDKETIESLITLKGLPGEGIILSHPENGGLIRAVAGREPLADLGIGVVSDMGRLEVSYEIFNSRNLDKTSSRLMNWSIRYIWLDQWAVNDIWGADQEGLLFLFRNNETFKKIEDSSGIQIWEVLRQIE